MSVDLVTLEGDCGCGGITDRQLFGEIEQLCNSMLPDDAVPVAFYGDVYEDHDGSRWMDLKGFYYHSPSVSALSGEDALHGFNLGSLFGGHKKSLLARISANINKGLRGARRKLLGKPKPTLANKLSNVGKQIGNVMLAPVKAIAGLTHVASGALLSAVSGPAKVSKMEKLQGILDMMPVEEPIPKEYPIEDPNAALWEQYNAGTGIYAPASESSQSTIPDGLDSGIPGGLLYDETGQPYGEVQQTGKESAQISPLMIAGIAAAAYFLLRK